LGGRMARMVQVDQRRPNGIPRTMTCRLPGCSSRRERGRTLCAMHRRRWRLYRRFEFAPMMKQLPCREEGCLRGSRRGYRCPKHDWRYRNRQKRNPAPAGLPGGLAAIPLRSGRGYNPHRSRQSSS
jgi:hypothetical protein